MCVLAGDRADVVDARYRGYTGTCGFCRMVGGGWGRGASTVDVTWRYTSTSTIQIFAVLSSVKLCMLSSLAEC